MRVASQDLRLTFGVECRPVTFFPQVMVVDFERAVLARRPGRSLLQSVMRIAHPTYVATKGSPGQISAVPAGVLSDTARPIPVNGTAVDGLRTVVRMGGRLNVIHRSPSEQVREVLTSLELDKFVLTAVSPGRDAWRLMAQKLCDRYGKRGYALMAGADVPEPLFAVASRAFLVGGSEKMRRKLLVYGVPSTLLPADPVTAEPAPAQTQPVCGQFDRSGTSPAAAQSV